MNHADLPTPFDLVHSPELASLTLLEYALQVTVRALVATYPQLQDGDVPYWRVDPSPACKLASSIVTRAGSLTPLIRRYSAQLPPDPPGSPHRDDDVPF